MALKLANNSTSVLASNINASTTTISIESGDESRFPTLAGGDWHPLTVVDGSGNMEIMRCTARSGVTLTVVRGQEGTTAQSFSAGAKVDVRLTAAALIEVLTDASRLTTGQVDRALLGDGLQAVATEIDDLDAVDATGFYRNPSDATSSPTAHAGFFWHVEADDGSAYQVWRRAVGGDTRERNRVLDVWSSWTQMRPSAAAQDALFFLKAGGAFEGKITTLESTAEDGAGINIAPGVAPDTPETGDIWNTPSGWFVRYEDATKQLATLDAVLPITGGTLTGLLVTKESTSGAEGSAGFRLPPGAAPTTPVNGDLWTTSTGIFARYGGTTHQLASAANVAAPAQEAVFTVSGTWTKPAGARWVRIQLWGGGGGGGNTTGGGGGAYCELTVPASALGATEAVVVGAGVLASTAGIDTTFAGLRAGGGAAGINGGGSSATTPGGTHNSIIGENGGPGITDNLSASVQIYSGAGGGNGSTSLFGGSEGVAPGGGGTRGAVGRRGEARITSIF